jgi:Ca2+/H+ antiporter
MQRAVENISEKTGMPPGSFISVGERSYPSKFIVL